MTLVEQRALVDRREVMPTNFKSAMVEDLVSARNRLSQVENRLNDTQGRPLTLDEQQQLTNVQVTYDDLYRGIECGGSPPPLNGETPKSYESRLVGQLQTFTSGKLRDLDMARLARGDMVAFNSIAGEIRRDVQRVIDDPLQGSFKSSGPSLREVKVADRSGRIWSEFRGSPSVWMNQFKLQPRCVLGFYEGWNRKIR
jgi:hypothetical protein